MSDILKKLGKRIREERKSKGLTQEKLAEKVELSRRKKLTWTPKQRERHKGA